MCESSDRTVYLYQPGGGRESRAAILASRFRLPFTHTKPAGDFYLMLTDRGLGLFQQGEHAPGAIHADFTAGAVDHRRRFGGGRGQPLARALGLRAGQNPDIIDATAGLGRDAFVLATLGCKVTLCERSPVLAALLHDGLERGASHPDTAAIVQRMTLYQGNSCDHLGNLSAAQRPDAIYLDPMYPEKTSSARVKKEMAALRQLLGADRDSRQLLDIALATARKRVVVKRPLHADNLQQLKPHCCISSKKTRFDIYMV